MIIYLIDEEGVCQRLTYAKQCPAVLFGGQKCQGIEGHTDNHWSYGPFGMYYYQVQEPMDIACGQIPPGHKHWISPLDKVTYHNHLINTEIVTDPVLIQKIKTFNVDATVISYERLT